MSGKTYIYQGVKSHLLVILASLFVLVYGVFSFASVHAANPSIISFQGKVVNADGTNVTNGSYNFDFVMYNHVTLGTPSDGVYDKWHELTKSVTVTNGVFQTNLGSATALPDFNANPSLYLAVRFNADAAGYMSPRVQMASVPYAANADTVGGVGASNIVQLGASQSGNINIGTGTLTSGNINGQTISTSANFTGTLAVQGASVTVGATGQAGSLVLYDNDAGSETVTLVGGAISSSYSLTLPGAVGSTSQCLQTDASVATQLIFGSCSAGGSLQAAYTASTGSTTPEIVLDTTRNGFDIQDQTGGTIGATQGLFNVRGVATGSTLGASLFTVNGLGQVAIKNGGTTATPTINYDLSFGQDATPITRTIGIEDQVTAATAGNALTVTTGKGNTSGAGGLLILQSGQGGSTGAGGAVTIQAGSGGSTSGAGGVLTLQGGNATAGVSNGGNVVIAGGASSSTGTPSTVSVTSGSAAGAGTNGGTISLTTGSGNTFGAGGQLSLNGGTGGTTGSGGAIVLTGGNGGSTSGIGGNITLQSGSSAGGNSAGGTMILTSGGGTGSGAGGTINIYAAAGGATGTGGSTTVKGGAGGGTSGAGGALILQGGNAIAGNSAGGNINILSGQAIGTGAASTVSIASGAAVGATIAGGALTVTSGAGNTSGAGGLLSVSGGNGGASGDGGGINIQPGSSGGTTGAGGVLNLQGGTGAATGSAGGTVNILGGVSGSGGTASAVNITAGAAVSATVAGGGRINITSGAGAVSDAGGLITVRGGVGGPTGVGGGLSLISGAGGSTSGNSGAITLQSGNVTSGTAGAVLLDVGTSSIGSAAINIGTSTNSPAKNITIGGSNQTGNIDLGTGTGVQAINLGTGGTGAKTVTLGSTASTGVTTLQAGASGSIALNHGTITTNATTLAFLNTTATTVSTFGAATTLNVGANGGSSVFGGDIYSKGIAWTSRTASVASNWGTITYGKGIFVAIAYNAGASNDVMTSPDGINWTTRTASHDDTWSTVVYGNGLFVAVADGGTINAIMTSPDGITWTDRNAPSIQSWYGLAYGNGMFVSTTVAASGAVMYSRDGITWYAGTNSNTGSFYSVTYGNGTFVAVATIGTNKVMTSTDGITWSNASASAPSPWISVTYGNGLFVAVANANTTRVMTSTNGTSWTSQTAAVALAWNSVTYGAGLYVAVSSSGVGNRVMTSPDGISWSSRNSASDSGWIAIGYGNGMFISVGPTGALMSSGKNDLNAALEEDRFITTQTFDATTTFNSTATFRSLVVTPAADSLSSFQVTSTTGEKIMNINSTSTKNLLVNSSFEGATNGWSVVGGSTLSSSATQAKVGTKSLSIVTAATNPSGTSYTYPFKANTTYTLSFYAYASTLMTTIFSYGRTVNGSATDCATNTTLTIAWNAFSCTFTTGATVTQADNFYIQKTGATTPTFFVDSVQLEQASAATTYAEPGFSMVNLVAYPSFENSNTNGWAVKSGTTPVGNSIAASGEFSQFGTQSMKVVTGTSAVAGNGAEYRYQFKPSTQYSLSIWARKDTGTSTAFAIGRQDVSGTDVNCTTTPDITSVGLTATWTQFTCSFTTGATITEPSNFYLKQSDTATSDNVYIDGVTLVEAASGLSFVANGNNIQVDALNNNIILNGSGSGELQPWRTSSSQIGATSPTAASVNREQAATVTANGYIYVIGGYDGSNAVNTIYYAKMNSDGSTQGWTTSATTLPAVLRYPAASFINGYMYVVGGANTAGTAQSAIYYSKLNHDGTLGTWQTSIVTLPAARLGSSVGVINGVMYIAGGCTDVTCTTNAVNTIYYGKVTADGSIRGITTPNTLNTNANNLTQNRGMGSMVIANGNMYYIGGSGSSPTSGANSTVYTGVINTDYSIAAFTTGTALPSARVQHVSAIANGYIYTIGGCTALTTGSCSSGTATSTVFYSNMNGDGSLGTWLTGANALPEGRGAATVTLANSYIYVLGGFDGTARNATVYYASTPRTQIAGGLDLVGLNSQGLADAGGAGNLTAGNTRIVGALTVDGYADFNNGASVDSVLNINSVTATVGQAVFNINNSSANSIFSIQHMSANFGSLISGGAFISNTSTFEEDFAVNKTATAVTVDTLNLGDTSAFNFDTFAATTTFSTPTSVLGGVGRISMNAAIGNGSVFGIGRASATLNGSYLKANLPVVQMKIKPSLNNTGEDIKWGLIPVAQAASATNDPAITDGIYFSNENTTSWVGVVRSGSANVGTVTCTGTISNANYAVGRIVVESASLVHFYMDYNASDGINFADCGTVGVNTNPTAALALGIVNAHSVATASTIDIDYLRTWQDDAPETSAENSPETSKVIPVGDEEIVTTTEPLLKNDAGGTTADQMGIIDLLTATSEDTVFNRDVYVRGTLFADKIKANQIEGLEIFTNQLASLRQQVDSETGKPVANANSNAFGGIDLNNFSVQTATIALNLNVTGGLNIGGDANFRGNAAFYRIVTFIEKSIFKNDVSFEGRPTFNNDTAGYAVIHAGQQEVQVAFEKQYETIPIVSISVNDGQFIQYSYKDLTPQGFKIVLPAVSTTDTNFSWIAIQVKDARTQQVTPEPTIGE